MNTAGYWNKDWCLGLAVTLVPLFEGGTSLGLFPPDCGGLPFEGDSAAQFLYKTANEPAPEVPATTPKFPPAFVAFLERATAKNSDERYQTGEEFAAAMRASIGSTGAVVGATTDLDISL